MDKDNVVDLLAQANVLADPDAAGLHGSVAKEALGAGICCLAQTAA